MSLSLQSVAISALKVATVTIVFSAKAFLYLCIALYVVGELLFKEYAQTEPSPIEAPIPAIADPWEEVAPTPAIAKTIARPAVLAVDVSDAVKESIAIDADARRYQGMTSPQLRQECGKVGIQWRSVHGKNKHLSKAEMLAALAA
jgi:hypothetical protein